MKSEVSDTFVRLAGWGCFGCQSPPCRFLSFERSEAFFSCIHPRLSLHPSHNDLWFVLQIQRRLLLLIQVKVRLSVEASFCFLRTYLPLLVAFGWVLMIRLTDLTPAVSVVLPQGVWIFILNLLAWGWGGRSARRFDFSFFSIQCVDR